MTLITLIYSIALITFGFLAYYKTGSRISLYTSLFFGTLLLSTCIVKNKKWKRFAPPILTFILSATFITRAIVTQKPSPAIWATFSCFLFLLCLYRFLRLREKVY